MFSENLKLSLEDLVFLSKGDDFDIYKHGPFLIWNYRRYRKSETLSLISSSMVMIQDFLKNEVRIFEETTLAQPKYELVTRKFEVCPNGTFLASFVEYATKEEDGVFYFIGVRNIKQD